MQIKLDDIIPNRFQPREVFNENELNKLADSIRQHGVIEPILVRPVSNKYEIVAGERRYKASVLAGLTKIPAIVRQLDDKESSIIAFIENEHRSNVSAIEEARTMDRILKNNNMTQEELAKELGINQSTVANKIRLLNLSTDVQDALLHNQISERHARSILSVKDEEEQKNLLKRIIERKMTVRELDSEIKNMNNNGFNYDSYSTSNGVDSTTPAPQNNDGGFMDFMNNYASNANSTPPQTPAKEEGDAGFLDFLNNYDKNYNVNQETTPSPQNSDSGFMDFMNNYDKNYKMDLPKEEPSTPTEGSGDSASFLNFMDNYDKNYSVKKEETEISPAKEEGDAGFLDFLNNYDKNYNANQEATPAPQNSDSGFMDFMNNYDKNYKMDLPEEEPSTPNEGSGDSASFLNFMDNYDKNYQPSVDKSELDYGLYNTTSNTNTDNVTISNVTPPITTGFDNQYVEDNVNYVDITKQEKINSVDEIIQKLSSVVNEIKEKSIFKVDTDEINYDDIYQITIKIDKRDF